MKTEVITETLSDGSEVYDVRIVDDFGENFILNCVDKKSALKVKEVLDECVIGAFLASILG